MLTFLKTIGVIGLMVMIIPLAVWAGSGNWRHGLFALKAYLRVMGLIVGAGIVLAGVFWLAASGAS